MAGMTKKRSKTVLISIRVSLEVRTQTNVVKKKSTSKKLKKEIIAIVTIKKSQ